MTSLMVILKVVGERKAKYRHQTGGEHELSRVASFRSDGAVSVLAALMLALLPSCSEARSDTPDLSPQAERVVNEAADLLFGTGNSVLPVVDYRKSQGGVGFMEPSCYGYIKDLYKDKEEHNKSKELRAALRLGFSWFDYSGIVCDSVTPLDKNIAYESPWASKDSLQVVYNITSKMGTKPVLRRPVERFTQRFFAKSGSYCELWLRRNDIGQINFAAVRILSKPPKQYSVEDNQQQECFIRGSLMALGLEGAAELPFEKLAYRAPFPVGLSRSVLPRSKMRRYTMELVGLIFNAAPEKDFEPFTRNSISRDKFVEMLAGRPDIEDVAKDLARFEKKEQEEREAKTAPAIPPFVPPRSVRISPEPSVRQ